MDLTKKQCKPCEGGTPFSSETEDEYLIQTPDWTIERLFEHKIYKVFTFETFMQAIDFVNKIAAIAETEGHHPELHINYKKVKVELYTHAMMGLSENDFILAAKINELFAGDSH
jgi:4a-hydroxytetrahydrobiopterin dehydratase